MRRGWARIHYGLSRDLTQKERRQRLRPFGHCVTLFVNRKSHKEICDAEINVCIISKYKGDWEIIAACFGRTLRVSSWAYPCSYIIWIAERTVPEYTHVVFFYIGKTPFAHFYGVFNYILQPTESS